MAMENSPRLMEQYIKDSGVTICSQDKAVVSKEMERVTTVSGLNMRLMVEVLRNFQIIQAIEDSS